MKKAVRSKFVFNGLYDLRIEFASCIHSSEMQAVMQAVTWEGFAQTLAILGNNPRFLDAFQWG
ncbi:hypothetical protein BWI93_23460 [Siphonobacter sp. BAB-5385]|nr:hypothetical protein BWI93_23460 [Siphonobacter sp. BAB-5385]PMD90502.1 hypothetical protein BWI97_23820 [Siphonobacter sp. BAB-5405]